MTLFNVRSTERYASRLTIDGHLYEFDLGRFWRTNLIEDDPRRREVEDPVRVPIGPCYHSTLCDCELCRAQ